MASSETGTIDSSNVVFLPSSVRVTAVSATAGAAAQPGATILRATSTTRVIGIDLDDVNLRSKVRVGDEVMITLPDQSTTPGTVTAVGTVATIHTRPATASPPSQ